MTGIIDMINALEAKMGKEALRSAIHRHRSPNNIILMSQDRAIRLIYQEEFRMSTQAFKVVASKLTDRSTVYGVAAIQFPVIWDAPSYATAGNTATALNAILSAFTACSCDADSIALLARLSKCLEN
jgi:hypothetical protein